MCDEQGIPCGCDGERCYFLDLAEQSIWDGVQRYCEKRADVIRKEEPPGMINRPPHYNAGKVECIEAATINLTGIDAVCTGNAIKYLWRWKQKGGVEDLRKAKWYLDRLITSQHGGDPH